MSSSSLAAALLLAVAISCHCHVARGWGGFGVNYGTVADDLPTAARSVELLRAAGAGAVKIYDANADILRALAGTGMPVSVMVPNDAIPSLAASPAAADEWVARNLAPHLPAARVVCLLVSNEVLSDRAIAGTTWPILVLAMANLRRALCGRGLARVKVGTTLAMDALAASYPPSAGVFRDDITGPVVRPLLKFLNATGSYYLVDAYPYFAWAANHRSISLDYALFQGAPSTRYVDPGTGLTYTNLFDQMLDAVVAAMARLGYGNVKLAVSETGWPAAGDVDELGANIHNAATYNRNLAARMAKNPGTPARPGAKMTVFLFSLYNENHKSGPGTERRDVGLRGGPRRAAAGGVVPAAAARVGVGPGRHARVVRSCWRRRQGGERDGDGGRRGVCVPAGERDVRRHPGRRRVQPAGHARRACELRVQCVLAAVQEGWWHLLLQWPCREDHHRSKPWIMQVHQFFGLARCRRRLTELDGWD